MKTFCLFALAFAFAAAPLTAAEPAADEAQIGALITQLGDTDFQKRQAATEQLKAIGKPAVPQLEVAAKNDDPEIRERANVILAALRPAPAPATTTGRQGFVVRGGNVIALGGGVMRIQALAGNAAEVKVTATSQSAFTHDGKKYKVTRSEVNGVKSLKVEITETKDGKEVTRTVEATDDETLAKQEPELAQIIKEHGGKAEAEAAQVQMGGQIILSQQEVPADCGPMEDLN